MNKILHEKEFKSIDGKIYNYAIFELEVKKLKNEFKIPHIVFYTFKNDNNDTLREIEDLAEEVVKLNKLPITKTKFFEYREDEVFEIIMNWDNNRFRGTIWDDFLKSPEIGKKYLEVFK